jgi:aminoglycoside/choline kinase family phosphotransferase
VEALRAFRACEWESCPNAPFDAAFFRRELAVFEQFALPQGAAEPEATEFLDRLCERVAAHPYRLVHRDYHVNNLFLCGSAVRAVDYQDMRGGPDTYDAVSLLRERAGGERLESDSDWREGAAAALGWAPGWEVRYLECAAQRGVKVIGTFLRLASWGRSGYLAKLPLVRRRAAEALTELGAPRSLIDAALPPEAA